MWNFPHFFFFFFWQVPWYLSWPWQQGPSDLNSTKKHSFCRKSHFFIVGKNISSWRHDSQLWETQQKHRIISDIRQENYYLESEKLSILFPRSPRRWGCAEWTSGRVCWAPAAAPTRSPSGRADWCSTWCPSPCSSAESWQIGSFLQSVKVYCVVCTLFSVLWIIIIEGQEKDWRNWTKPKTHNSLRSYCIN